MAEVGSQKWRENVGEGTKRGLRPWRGGLKILPKHIRQLLARHEVHPVLRDIVHDEVRSLGELVAELGGHDSLTARQRALLRPLFLSSVALEAYLARAIREGDVSALGAASPHVNTVRSILSALGGPRSDDGVTDYEEALQRYGTGGREGVEVASSVAPLVARTVPDPAHAPDDDRAVESGTGART